MVAIGCRWHHRGPQAYGSVYSRQRQFSFAVVCRTRTSPTRRPHFFLLVERWVQSTRLPPSWRGASPCWEPRGAIDPDGNNSARPYPPSSISLRWTQAAPLVLVARPVDRPRRPIIAIGDCLLVGTYKATTKHGAVFNASGAINLY